MQHDSASFICLRVIPIDAARSRFISLHSLPLDELHSESSALRIDNRDRTSRHISAQYVNSAIALRRAKTVNAPWSLSTRGEQSAKKKGRKDQLDRARSNHRCFQRLFPRKIPTMTRGTRGRLALCVLSLSTLLTSLKTKYCIDLTASPPWRTHSTSCPGGHAMRRRQVTLDSTLVLSSVFCFSPFHTSPSSTAATFLSPSPCTDAISCKKGAR